MGYGVHRSKGKKKGLIDGIGGQKVAESPNGVGGCMKNVRVFF